MGAAPCASQGVCHCKGGTGTGGCWGPHWDFSPLLTELFFPAEGSCSPWGAVTPRSLALCAFPRAAVALQLMVLYFSTKTFRKSPTRCEWCLRSVAAPAPLHSPSALQTVRGAGTLNGPAPFPCHEPSARSPLPRSFLSTLCEGVRRPHPFPSQPWAGCPFLPLPGL